MAKYSFERKRQSKTTYFIASRPGIMFSGGIIIMEQNVNRKHRTYSAVERASLLEAYKTSGVLKKQWCNENDIGLSTLQKWLYTEKKQEKPKAAQSWVPVLAVTPAKPDVLPVQIGKITIPVDQHTNLKLLSAVLQVVTTIC
jgi:transposase-like protein